MVLPRRDLVQPVEKLLAELIRKKMSLTAQSFSEREKKKNG